MICFPLNDNNSTSDTAHIFSRHLNHNKIFWRCTIWQRSWLWFWSSSGGCISYRERERDRHWAKEESRVSILIDIFLGIQITWKSPDKMFNAFTGFENLDDVADHVDVSMTWKGISENVKDLATESQGYYELNQHTLWFDKQCPKMIWQEGTGWIAKYNEVESEKIIRTM
jgi:hypothetical protein